MSDSQKEITLELFVNAFSELKKQPKFAHRDNHTLARYAYEQLFFCAGELADLEREYDPLRKWFTFLYGFEGRTRPILQAAKHITGCENDDVAYDELYQLLVVTTLYNDETYPPIEASKLLNLWDRHGVPENLLEKLKSDYAHRIVKESAEGDNEVETQ